MPDNSVVEFPDDFTAEQIESHLKDFTKKPEAAPSFASQLPTSSPWAIQPPGEELRQKILSIPAQAMEQVATPASDLTVDFLRRTGIDPSAAAGKPTVSIPSIPLIRTMDPLLGYLAPEFTRGAEQKLGELVSGFTEPGQAPLLAAAPASKTIQALFAATAAAQIPESIQQVTEAKTPKEFGAALAGAAADVGMTGLMGSGLLKGKYARSKPETAALYGDVRTQQKPAEVLPAQEGGAGVQPQAQAVAKETSVPLTEKRTPEQIALDDIASQKYEEAERAAISEAEAQRAKVNVVKEAPPEDENVPFAAGQFMRPNEQGGIDIHQPNFRSWVRNTLSRLPPEQQRQAIAARIDEELRHIQVIKGLGGLSKSNEAMASFWNDLTGFEKRLEHRSYTGVWTPEGLGQTLSDSELGHEVVRRRMQKLAGATTSEISETVGLERWTVKGINALSDMVYNARQLLGTKASARQRAVWDKIQENLEVAKEVASGGAAPGARERRQPEEGIQAIRPAVRLINGDIKEGKKGEVHNDIMERHKLEGVDVDRRGFMGPQGWIDREQGPDSGREVPGMHASELAKMQEVAPGARQRGKKQPYEPEQEKMFNVEHMTARGVPGSTETVQPISAGEAGALPAITLEQEVNKAITSERPSFHDFASSVQRNVAGFSTVKEPQLRELWEDKVWVHLVSAPGARIEELLKSLQLESKLNPQLRKLAGVRGVPQPRRIPDEFTQESSKQRRLAQAAAAYLGEQPDLVRLEQDRKQIELGQRLRRHAITEIGMKLLRESMPEMGLDRKEVTLDDIDFENARVGSGAYHLFKESEANDPDKYTKVLEDRARPDKWSALSKTRRLAVLVNKQTGAVEIVGAYKHGRQGIEIVDPTGATGVRGKEHFAISNYLGRYRLHASILLRDPVQFFHQHYDKLSEFANNIEEMAVQREKVAELEDAGESVDERKFMSQLFPGEEVETPKGLEPQEDLPPVGAGVKGEGGMFMGPEAAKARGMMAIGKGFARGRPLQSSEANALREFVASQYGAIHTPEDMAAALVKLRDFEPGKKLRELAEPQQYRKAIDALRKVAYLLRKSDEIAQKGLKPSERTYLSEQQYYENAIQHFFEALSTTENPADYTQKALGRFSRLVGEELPATEGKIAGAPAGPGPARIAASVAKGERQDLLRRQRAIGQGPLQPREMMGVTRTAPGTLQQRLEPPEKPQKPYVKAEAQLGTPIMEQPKATGKGLYYPKLKALKREGGVPYYPTEPGQPQPLPQELKQAWLGALGRDIPPAARQRKMGEVMTRVWDDFKDTIKGTIPDLKAITSRAFTMHDLFAYKQGARNAGDNQAVTIGNMLRLASFEGESRSRAAKAKAALVRRAVSAVIASRVKDAQGNLVVKPGEFTNLLNYVEVGRRKGVEMMKYSQDPKVRKYGRKVVDAAEGYKEEIEYARDHWDEADMQNAVWTFDHGAEQHREAMNAAGFQIAAKENWVPGRYLGELWMDNTITFGPNKILGMNFGRPKTFNNKYQAYANPSRLFGKERRTKGAPPLVPYVSVNNDTADLLQHSISRGLRMANNQQWMEWLRSQKDPASGQPIAVKPKLVQGMVEGEDPETGEIVNKPTLVPKPPSPDYVIVRTTPNGPAMAIREGYRKQVALALAPSRIEEYPVLREAHIVASMLKHGLILMLDSFHLARLGQYSLALGAKNWGKSLGYNNGISALTWSEADLPEAVDKGFVSKENADWALEKVPVYNPNGTVKRTETRSARINEALRRGMNAATNADTLYRDAINNIPFIGEAWGKVLRPVNKFIFDKVTPGMIAESFEKNFERLHKANPKIPYDNLMRDVIRDTNVFYGNLGRQGFFKNATFRDLASIIILAPLWREGLLRKEAMFWSRASGLSYLMGRRGMGFNAYMGTLGRGVAVGLGTWFAVAQAINLISKGHFTWQNDEEGHALDAWIPTPKGGVWISTLGVFAELTHDLIRLGETKPKAWDAITQMGENSMGPIGRLAHIGFTGRSPTGQQYTSTVGILGGMASELAPTPISLATPLRAAGVGQPLRPGEALQRGLATITGTKSTLATRPTQDIQRKAERWLRSEGLKYEPMVFTPTDEASYAKLRGAVRNDDIKGARKILEELRKHKTDAQIMHALKVFSRHPFTGTLQHERMFMYSLDDKDLDLYQKATQERFETYSKAVDLILSQ